MTFSRGVVSLWIVGCVIACLPVSAAAAGESLRLLFWQPQDIVDGQNVHCRRNRSQRKPRQCCCARPRRRRHSGTCRPTQYGSGPKCASIINGLRRGKRNTKISGRSVWESSGAASLSYPSSACTHRRGMGRTMWCCSVRRTNPRGADSMCSRSREVQTTGSDCCTGTSLRRDRPERCWPRRPMESTGPRTTAVSCSRNTTTPIRWCAVAKTMSPSVPDQTLALAGQALSGQSGQAATRHQRATQQGPRVVVGAGSHPAAGRAG